MASLAIAPEIPASFASSTRVSGSCSTDSMRRYAVANCCGSLAERTTVAARTNAESHGAPRSITAG